MRIAVISWTIAPCASFDQWLGHAEQLIRRAVALDSDTVVLPELIDLERLWPYVGYEMCEVAPRLAEDNHRWPEFCRHISTDLGITLVGGSVIVEEVGLYFNRCYVSFPDGKTQSHDKKVLTQFEAKELNISPSGLRRNPVAENGHLHPLICYEIEFPRLAEPIADAGVPLIAVPTFTDTVHGSCRVATSAQARATELQVFVATASLRGSLGCEPVPGTVGHSSIFAPQIAPFPADGILAQTGEDHADDLAVADLDFDLLSHVRLEGDVRNYEDGRRLRNL